jgi:hypothetical protein
MPNSPDREASMESKASWKQATADKVQMVAHGVEELVRNPARMAGHTLVAAATLCVLSAPENFAAHLRNKEAETQENSFPETVLVENRKDNQTDPDLDWGLAESGLVFPFAATGVVFLRQGKEKAGRLKRLRESITR